MIRVKTGIDITRVHGSNVGFAVTKRVHVVGLNNVLRIGLNHSSEQK